MTKFYLILSFWLIAFTQIFAQNSNKPRPASVIYETKQGISGRGAIEFLRNDTLCIRDERDHIMLLSLARLVSYEFFDADGNPVSFKKGETLRIEPTPKTVEFVSLPTDTTKNPKNRVKITLKKGSEINGSLLWRRGDSIAVDAGLGQPILLMLGQIENIRREGTPEENTVVDNTVLDNAPKKSETKAQKDIRVRIKTKDGKMLTGSLLWKRQDSVAINAGIGQPVVLPIAQIERIFTISSGDNIFRQSRPDEKFDNYMALLNLVAHSGFPIRQGQSYVRLVSSLGLLGASRYETGLRLNDYFQIRVNSIASILIVSATPSVVFPITPSFYLNAGVNIGFNVFARTNNLPTIQISGYTAGLALSQPSFSMGLQYSRLRGISQFIPSFDIPSNFYRNQISLPFQYRITQNWLFLAEFTTSPFSENARTSVSFLGTTVPVVTSTIFKERFNHIALAGRYLQPRYFIDFGLGFAKQESQTVFCSSCANLNQSQSFPSISAGAGVLIGKRAKK